MEEGVDSQTPDWVEEFRDKFSSGLAHTFILHGAVEDYVGDHCTRLDHYLSEFLGESRVVVFYNCSRGISFAAPAHRTAFLEAVGLSKEEAPAMNEPFLPEPSRALPLLEQALLSPDLKSRAALIVEYPELIWPGSDFGHLSDRDRSALAALRRWAVSSEFIAAGQVIMLITQTASDLHPSLRSTSSMIEEIEVAYPDLSERLAFIENRLQDEGIALDQGLTPESFASLTGGLSRVLVDDICLRAALYDQPVSLELIRERKEQIIRQEYGELIEILEPRHGFAEVGGLREVKEYLMKSVIAPLKGEAPKERMPSGVLLAGPPGTGKGQPLNAKVLTPEGWTTIGQLKVGDQVIDPVTGEAANILGIYPQGEQEVFRLNFSDGTSTECDDSHLWSVRRHGYHTDYRVYEMGKIRNLMHKVPSSRFYIPTQSVVHFAPLGEPLPLDPYLLGALLGDGSLRTVSPSFTNADAEIVREVSDRLPAGDLLRRYECRGPYEYAVTKASGRYKSGWQNVNGRPQTRRAIEDLGLYNLMSSDKFVPSCYLLASPEERLELLRGLMDTDGSIDNRGCAEFSSCSPRLVRDLAFLVRSLGGRCRIRVARSGYRDAAGRMHKCKDRHRAIVQMPAGTDPFRLKRKRSRLREKRSVVDRRIVSIEALGLKETRCIKLDSKSELYMTDDFLVTHNTHIVSALAYEAGVNVVKLNAGRLLGQYVGNSERNLERALACIRSLSPTLVMIDEIEQQFQRGGKGDGGVERRIFGRILEEMSGASGTQRGEVVWFAATNRIELVDPALRRPGRFDRIVPILPPSPEERWQILHTKLPQGFSFSEAEGSEILALTEGYTGADLDGVLIKASELSLDQGKGQVEPEDLLAALRLLRPGSDPGQNREMIEAALSYCNDLSLVPPEWRNNIPAQTE